MRVRIRNPGIQIVPAKQRLVSIHRKSGASSVGT